MGSVGPTFNTNHKASPQLWILLSPNSGSNNHLKKRIKIIYNTFSSTKIQGVLFISPLWVKRSCRLPPGASQQDIPCIHSTYYLFTLKIVASLSGRQHRSGGWQCSCLWRGQSDKSLILCNIRLWPPGGDINWADDQHRECGPKCWSGCLSGKSMRLRREPVSEGT